MQISKISNINTFYSPNVLKRAPFVGSNGIHFMGKDLYSDVFQKEQEINAVMADSKKSTYNKGLHLFNPVSNYDINIEEDIDITKPQTFTTGRRDLKNCTIEFDPKKKGQLVDKKTGEPIDVFILKLHDMTDKYIDSFHFVSEDFKHEYGHVEFDNSINSYCEEFTKNYIREQIFGNRIIVNWLINEDDKNIGGVGKLADKVAVKYCLDKKIRPNIISTPADDSHLAHYSRGKRFIRPKMFSDSYNFLLLKYGTVNPNKALERLLEKSKNTGEPVDLSEWNKHFFVMYLPHNLVEKYKKEDY